MNNSEVDSFGNPVETTQQNEIQQQPADNIEPVETSSSEKKWKIINYIGMLLIGLINNLPYWVAYANTQAICTHFNKDGYIGAVSWGIVILSIFATLGNAFLTSKNVSYNIRSIINGAFMFVGLIGTAVAPNIFVAILFIAFVGVSSDFGEGVMLGYFASLDNDALLGAWGIGTGISGVFGAGYSLICQKFKVSYFLSFICMSPTGILYPLIFILMLKNPNTATKVPEQEEPEKLEDIEQNDAAIDKQDEEEKVPFCSCSNWYKSLRFILNNLAMFCFQYISLIGLTDCSMTKKQKVDEPFIFGYFSICYQCGGLIGRSIKKWFLIKKLEITTVITGCLFVIMLVNAIVVFIAPIYMLIPLFLIGFFGAISYMSVFAVIMEVPNTTQKEREIITNYASVFIGGSIQVSSLITLLLQNVIIKKQCSRE
ncbi:CLN3 protein [Trichomonas vaginalis G3]|uniref:CLN3 protein n=1 Tax=Trichomonas vaginalis (strain ATCC PRA-98 / G3) TaxID=412133 RepID=A2G2I4_TRIV3|nr:CLN3 protein family [Trichomonas vaginalis G3]EAX88642.1 CLN3 protein [Trichomonas vaginalis G3]KAI5501637.1 CLN3 protein family [Trichomonas vaginalis G3]|eukprot:XP_001301572.1 CLN3 protein [Trichomonas vaginalis G3]